MRLKFWKQPEEIYFEDEKPKRKPETLSQVAEKILIRKMKKNPDEYGLEAAEKIKGIGKPEEKSLIGQLKEYRELQRVMQDIGGGNSGEGSWLKDIGKGVAEALAPSIVEIIKAKAGQLPATRQLDVGKTEQLEAEPEPQAEKRVFDFNDLVSVMEMKPDEALIQLTQANPEWLTLLSNSDYSSFIDLLQKVPSTKETDKALRELLSSERQQWLESLILIAKGTGL